MSHTAPESHRLFWLTPSKSWSPTGRTLMALSLLSLLLAACASRPSSEPEDRPVFEGYAVESVREAARSVLEELAYGQWDVRASDWRVVTEGRIGRCDEHVDCGHGTRLEQQTLGTPWTTVEVRFEDVGSGVAVDVRIEYLTDAHCPSGWLEVECIPERLGSTGVLERAIVEWMRAGLEEEPAVMAIP